MFGEIKLLFKGFVQDSKGELVKEFEYWISDGVHWLKFESPEGQKVVQEIAEKNG